jgi:hypothetical protein
VIQTSPVGQNVSAVGDPHQNSRELEWRVPAQLTDRNRADGRHKTKLIGQPEHVSCPADRPQPSQVGRLPRRRKDQRGSPCRFVSDVGWGLDQSDATRRLSAFHFYCDLPHAHLSSMGLVRQLPTRTLRQRRHERLIGCRYTCLPPRCKTRFQLAGRPLEMRVNLGRIDFTATRHDAPSVLQIINSAKPIREFSATGQSPFEPRGRPFCAMIARYFARISQIISIRVSSTPSAHRAELDIAIVK